MSQELNFQKHSAKNCVHTKNIYSLLDTPKNDETYKRLMKHLETCSACAQELKKFETKTAAAQVFIPKMTMDRDLRQSFEREVGELFKVMDLNERELLKKKVKKSVRFLDNMGVDLVRTLVSKSMIKVYVITAAVVVGIKYFLK